MLLSCGVGEDLGVPWTARRSNQSTLKEKDPEYSLERLMLKLQYFGHLMQRADSLEKILMLGETEGRRRRGQDGWMASPTQLTDFEQAPGDSEDRGAWRAAARGVAEADTIKTTPTFSGEGCWLSSKGKTPL